MINIVKTKTLFSAPELSEVGGEFSEKNLFVYFRDDSQLNICALFENEIYKDGIYQGSLSTGRWSAVTPFSNSESDRSPTIHMANGEPDLLLWERDGGLKVAPSIISDEIINAQGTLKSELDSGFSVDFANLGGKFTRDESIYPEMFKNEKTAALEMGYNGEFQRMATGQIDPTKANRTIGSGILSLEYKNKYSELLGLKMTRNYGLIYPKTGKETMIAGFKVGAPIENGKTVEVRFQVSAPKRWYPDSVEIVNLSPNSSLEISKVYGTSEWYGFVQITNKSGTTVQPTFDVVASPCTSLAYKVYSGKLTVQPGSATTADLYIFNEIATDTVTLTEYIPAGLSKTNSFPAGVEDIKVSNIAGTVTYKRDKDYVVSVDQNWNAFIERKDDSAITSGQQVKVTYKWYNLVEPESIQLQITSINGSTNLMGLQGIPVNVSGLTANLYLFSPSVNGCGVEARLNSTASSTVTIGFEIWARHYNSSGITNGRYWTAGEIIEDIARIASRKELLLGAKSDKLKAGQFTDTVFVQIEEKFEFDPESVRIENTGSDECQFSILKAGTFNWPADSDDMIYGVLVAVARTFPTGPEVEYSFQIWGQYTDRTDFLFPFKVDCKSLPVTQFTKPVLIIDQTIEDALNKVKQVCFSERGEPYRMLFDRNGALKMIPYWTREPVLVAEARNMESIAKNTRQPKVIDRLEIKGHITNSFITSNAPECIKGVSVNVGSGGLEMTIQFQKSYNPGSLEIHDAGNYNSHQWIKERNPNYCVVMCTNDCFKIFGFTIGSAWANFSLWGSPLSSVQYQEDNTYKTEKGVSGKYTHVEATIENELITDSYLASRVAEQVRAESANGELELNLSNLPFHPGLDPVDTVNVFFDELDATTKTIVDEVSYNFNFEGEAPRLLMNVTAKPFDVFAADSGDDEITEDDEMDLEDEYEINDDADLRKLMNLIFG